MSKKRPRDPGLYDLTEEEKLQHDESDKVRISWYDENMIPTDSYDKMRSVIVVYETSSGVQIEREKLIKIEHIDA